MTYDDAKALRNQAEAKVTEASARLKSVAGVGSGGTGLTPDHVKSSSEYRDAKAGYDAAFRELQRVNAWFTQTYADEYRDERRRRGMDSTSSGAHTMDKASAAPRLCTKMDSTSPSAVSMAGRASRGDFVTCPDCKHDVPLDASEAIGPHDANGAPTADAGKYCRGSGRDAWGMKAVTHEAPSAVAMATSAKCPYCVKTVSMSRGSLGHHRAPGGTCDGSGKAVERVEFGRAVLMASQAGSSKNWNFSPGDRVKSKAGGTYIGEVVSVRSEGNGTYGPLQTLTIRKPDGTTGDSSSTWYEPA